MLLRDGSGMLVERCTLYCGYFFTSWITMCEAMNPAPPVTMMHVGLNAQIESWLMVGRSFLAGGMMISRGGLHVWRDFQYGVFLPLGPAV